MRECLWLVHNGVPFAQVFGEGMTEISDAQRRAFCIMFSEFQGAKFNLDTMEFEDHNA